MVRKMSREEELEMLSKLGSILTRMRHLMMDAIDLLAGVRPKSDYRPFLNFIQGKMLRWQCKHEDRLAEITTL